MTIARFAATALLIASGHATTAVGQDRATFRSLAELVVLHAHVQDRRGNYIANLQREAFAVFEDGQKQDIQLFINEDTPVTAGLLIDNSISMLQIREMVVAGSVAFAEASDARDEIFALAFNERVAAALPEDEPFTSDPVQLRSALTSAITARGRTALFDAVTAGLAYANRGTHHRKVLVVISDGGDNASTTTFEAILRLAQASNVVIYTVVLADPLERDANPKRMATLARATGGATYRPQQRKDVSNALQQIARDIRHTYTIGYRPAKSADGAFRPIHLVVSPADRQRVVVRTRDGYLALPPK